MASKGLRWERLDELRVLIPRQGEMRTEGLVYADEKIFRGLEEDEALTQVANVAWLPGIVGRSLAMPDIHWGYGFPIGGVAAFDVNEGIVSPGGVGYDINCGVRLIRTSMERDEITGRLKEIADALFSYVPCGVGSRRKDFKLKGKDQKGVLRDGARWAVQRGFGAPEDLAHIEENGAIPGADPSVVSPRALKRGKDQAGTLGSGNHFVEVGFVEQIFDEPAARAFGLFKDQVTVFLHSGSRGLGHQVCDDYIKLLMAVGPKFGIKLPDRQLCCAPVTSKEGQDYLAAMAAAANFAFANRQIMYHFIKEAFEKVFRKSAENMGFGLVYDVCHNIAKKETHEVHGQKVRVVVHRKGATRAFGPGHPDLPDDYRAFGQPVLIPGDMGRYSYVLAGTDTAMAETFGSTCHGAGRLMSRGRAKKMAKGRAINRELEDAGITVRSAGKHTLKEEMPEAYKDVADVVDVVARAGLGRKVARLRPLAVIKG